MAVTSFTDDCAGGRFGFLGTFGGNGYADDLTIISDGNNDGDFIDPEDKTEIVEDFELDDETDSYAEEKLVHDAAGNLTYDGMYKYIYDAWNRLVEVKRAYRTSGGTLTEGLTVATIEYDSLGRRIVKDVDNCGNWDIDYHYLYSGWQMVEMRNGSDDVIKQYVWGLTYVDELLQIGINDDPTDEGEDDCETFYCVLQDANFNVLGIVEPDGDLKERYEYSPYGQRTVYKSAGSDDPLCMSPIMDSQPVVISSVDQPYGLCDIGHQGLLHDKEFSLIYNRARYFSPTLGRFISRDPLRYINGMSLYEYVRSQPVGWLDPSGCQADLERNNFQNPINGPVAWWRENYKNTTIFEPGPPLPPRFARLVRGGGQVTGGVFSAIGGIAFAIATAPSGVGVGAGITAASLGFSSIGLGFTNIVMSFEDPSKEVPGSIPGVIGQAFGGKKGKAAGNIVNTILTLGGSMISTAIDAAYNLAEDVPTLLTPTTTKPNLTNTEPEP